MNPLISCRRVLTSLCIYPADNTLNKLQKRKRIITSLAIMVLLVTGLVASFAYAVKFKSTDLNGALFALMQVLAFITVLTEYIVAFYKRDEIRDVIISITEIYDASKNYRDNSIF